MPSKTQCVKPAARTSSRSRSNWGITPVIWSATVSQPSRSVISVVVDATPPVGVGPMPVPCG